MPLSITVACATCCHGGICQSRERGPGARLRAPVGFRGKAPGGGTGGGAPGSSWVIAL